VIVFLGAEWGGVARWCLDRIFVSQFTYPARGLWAGTPTTAAVATPVSQADACSKPGPSGRLDLMGLCLLVVASCFFLPLPPHLRKKMLYHGLSGIATMGLTFDSLTFDCRVADKHLFIHKRNMKIGCTIVVSASINRIVPVTKTDT
jgi:hypothetical protein